MPVAKLPTSGSPDAMKLEEGNDSLDTFIRQAIDLPGWPLMTPIKVQMHKCKKCSREFCSPINHRRHIRVHCRSLNVNKDSQKKRDLLAAFWDKLSLEEAKEVVSYNEVMLKEIPGSSVIKALASSLRKPGVWTLPQVYVRAGSSLVDIIQAKPSRLPISSQELFGILDDASERTFLCAGMPDSLQKYLFGGEAAKNSLELKNLVASTSFLFEQQLVKAWVADKDAEALRCQKLLVEEEEAAKKRLAEQLERKKQKKLRQKEHKMKEQFCGGKGDFNGAVDATVRPVLAEVSGPSSPSDSNSSSIGGPANVDSCLKSLQFQSSDLEKDIAQIDFSSECINQGDSQTIEPQMVGEHGHQDLATNSWQVVSLQSCCQYGLSVSHNVHPLKPEFMQKIGPFKDQALQKGSRVGTKKDNIESHGECLKPPFQCGMSNYMEENNCEVIIGSISIPLKSCSAQQQRFYPSDAQGTCSQQPAMLGNTLEKLIESDAVQSGTNRIVTKLWRPVSHGESRGIAAVERGNKDSEGVVVLKKVGDQIMSSGRCMPSQPTDDDRGNYNHVLSDGTGQQRVVPFSSIAAKGFLAHRWKEAVSADHVKLMLSSACEPSVCSDVQHDNSTTS